MEKMYSFYDIVTIHTEFMGTAKEIYLYGLNQDTKSAMVWLAQYRNCSITGFLLAPRSKHLSGMHYLGKSCISLGEVEDFSKCVIIDVFGNHITEIKQMCETTEVEILCKANCDSVIIYGAGDYGKQAFSLFSKLSVRVEAFCDKNPQKQGSIYCGEKIISPAELATKYRNRNVVVAINNGKKVCHELKKENISNPLYVYDTTFLRCYISLEYEYEGERKRIELLPSLLYYFFHFVTGTGRVLLLCGSVSNVLRISEILSRLGICIKYGIASNGFCGCHGNVEYLPMREVTGKSVQNMQVWVMPEAKDYVLHSIKKLLLDSRIFIYTSFSPLCIEYKNILDPSLGLNVQGYYSGIIPLCSSLSLPSFKSINVLILGNSTSEVTAFSSRGWPEFLKLLAEKDDILINCFVAAISGCPSSGELIRYLRDAKIEKFDVSISYSRVIDGALTNPVNHFIYRQLMNFYRDYDSNDKVGLCIGNGIESYAKHWLFQERMMHAIANEFGIRHYAVLQPHFFEKQPFYLRDYELTEHINFDLIRMKPLYRSIMREIREINSEHTYDWIYDASTIFDGCDEEVYIDDLHLSERGNQIVGEYIYRMIKPYCVERLSCAK